MSYLSPVAATAVTFERFDQDRDAPETRADRLEDQRDRLEERFGVDRDDGERGEPRCERREERTERREERMEQREERYDRCDADDRWERYAGPTAAAADATAIMPWPASTPPWR